MNKQFFTVLLAAFGFLAGLAASRAATLDEVALVVDDLASMQPWKPRGIEIRGDAEVLHSGGKTVNPYFNEEMFRIKPKRIYTWGMAEGEERLGGSGRSPNPNGAGATPGAPWHCTQCWRYNAKPPSA